jgi:AcrR family transcriptional regulator
MRDIAAEAGMSAASIYRYFADKDELFVEALLRESRDISEGLGVIMASNHDSSIEKVAVEFVDYLINRDAFFQMMTHFMMDGGISAKSLERFNEIERGLLKIFDGMFEDLGARGNVRLLSHAFFASLNGILITFRNYPGRSPEEYGKHMRKIAAIIADVFSKGI